ncbi:hypothetical protein Q5P01_000379 [Channa striata]|uniref:Ig-like domain-containing protein n=1 Tax=Channa striata TaxID=64152 RepID=A0AA88IC47_CHASR|nr:hypothetical protein Q5P01_000379 [Channa striata]
MNTSHSQFTTPTKLESRRKLHTQRQAQSERGSGEISFLLASFDGVDFTAMSCISMHCLLGAFILGAVLAAGPSETTLTAKVGEDITLDTGTSELHDDPEIYWTYGPNQNIIVHYENGEMKLKKSDRFELDERTGSLTIRSVNFSDSGLYQLNIISGSQHNFKLTVVESDPIQTTAGTPQNTTVHRPGGGTQRSHVAAGVSFALFSLVFVLFVIV